MGFKIVKILPFEVIILINFYLDINQFQISLGGKTITLLPKEFALFHFLYNHQNQGFSREALLNAVWTYETPTDRTVDDHIYRLRKKLKCWRDYLDIETIRGLGYRLFVVEQNEVIPPSVEDIEFNDQFKKIFSKYHLFGQGKAMQALADQQKILGVKLDPFYTMYTELIKGNWKILLDETFPFWDRAYFMIILYGLLEDDPLIGIMIIQRALQKSELELSRKWELKALDLVFFFIWNRQFDKACVHVDWALEMVSKHQIDNYHLAVLTNQVFVFLATSLGKAEEKLDEIKTLLMEKPYLRESSYFEIAKGIYHMKKDEKEAGKYCIHKGMEIMRATKFELQFFHAVTHVCHLLKQQVSENDELLVYYQKLRIDVMGKWNGEQLKNSLKKQLISFL